MWPTEAKSASHWFAISVMCHLILVQSLVCKSDAAKQCSYAKFSPVHTMCVKSNCRTELSGVTAADRQVILRVHNRWRSRVAKGKIARFPPAANMRLLHWDNELARTAQAHANLCLFEHDCKDCRRVGRFSTGQNLFTAWSQLRDDPVSNWTSAIDAWFEEHSLTPADVVASFRFEAGYAHFTQAAWASTVLIGCGYTMHREGGRYVHLYTCNYGPSGNIWGEPMYRSGKPCSSCPKRTKCVQGLCK